MLAKSLSIDPPKRPPAELRSIDTNSRCGGVRLGRVRGLRFLEHGTPLHRHPKGLARGGHRPRRCLQANVRRAADPAPRRFEGYTLSVHRCTRDSSPSATGPGRGSARRSAAHSRFRRAYRNASMQDVRNSTGSRANGASLPVLIASMATRRLVVGYARRPRAGDDVTR